MKRIAVLASGRGTNLKAIYESALNDQLPAKICCVISNNPKAGALDFAAQHQLPHYVISPSRFETPEEFGNALLDTLEKEEADWIVLAGYMKKIPANVIHKFPEKIVNIHPALLPSFGGKGMFGSHVHEAVFTAGVRVSGVTIHLVNSEYDSGPIVMQQAVDIDTCLSPQEIAGRVLQAEHIVYPAALKKLLTIPFKVEGKRVVFQNSKLIAAK